MGNYSTGHGTYAVSRFYFHHAIKASRWRRHRVSASSRPALIGHMKSWCSDPEFFVGDCVLWIRCSGNVFKLWQTTCDSLLIFFRIIPWLISSMYSIIKTRFRITTQATWFIYVEVLFTILNSKKIFEKILEYLSMPLQNYTIVRSIKCL